MMGQELLELLAGILIGIGIGIAATTLWDRVR